MAEREYKSEEKITAVIGLTALVVGLIAGICRADGLSIYCGLVFLSTSLGLELHNFKKNNP